MPFKPSDPKTKELSSKERKEFENKVVEGIKGEYDRIFYAAASLCDRIAFKGDELVFIKV
ncbi:MAG: hypothetical protein QXR79_00445 [Candidatus Bathyarchaeia archaeon]